jgi:hypothetical protein
MQQRKPLTELLGISFNQDFTCFAAGVQNGLRVYHAEPFKEQVRVPPCG